MRSSAAAQMAIDDGYGLRGFLRRMVTRASGLGAFMMVAFCLAALAYTGFCNLASQVPGGRQQALCILDGRS